jgi:hypothetical protein
MTTPPLHRNQGQFQNRALRSPWETEGVDRIGTERKCGPLPCSGETFVPVCLQNGEAPLARLDRGAGRDSPFLWHPQVTCWLSLSTDPCHREAVTGHPPGTTTEVEGPGQCLGVSCKVRLWQRIPLTLVGRQWRQTRKGHRTSLCSHFGAAGFPGLPGSVGKGGSTAFSATYSPWRLTWSGWHWLERVCDERPWTEVHSTWMAELWGDICWACRGYLCLSYRWFQSQVTCGMTSASHKCLWNSVSPL